MTFEKKNLSVLSQANGFTMWHYISDDSMQDMSTEGYFNEGAELLNVNDCVYIQTKKEPCLAINVVSSNEDGKVYLFGAPPPNNILRI